MTTPWRRRPSLFQDVALHGEPLVLGPEAPQLLLQGGRVPLAGEGPVAVPGQRRLPAAEHALAEVEVAGDLGQALAPLGDELDGLGLELGRERPSCLRHRWTPGFELTLLTRRPPSVGKSSCRLIHGGVLLGHFGRLVVWRFTRVRRPPHLLIHNFRL
jgi:hypothetical protein